MTRKSDSKAHCRSCTGAAEATPEWSYLQRGQYGLQWNPQEDRKILRILETPFQPSYKNIKTSKGVAKRLVIVIDNCMGQQTSEWNQCFMTESQRSQCFPLSAKWRHKQSTLREPGWQTVLYCHKQTGSFSSIRSLVNWVSIVILYSGNLRSCHCMLKVKCRCMKLRYFPYH